VLNHHEPRGGINFIAIMLDSEEQKKLFEERYNLYFYDCLRVANNILHNKTLAEESVHDAFLSIISAREKYLSLSCRDFQRLIVIIVRNKCFNIIKKDKKVANISMDDIAFEIPSDEPDIADEIIRQASVAEVRGYINKLDELSQEILYLKYDRQLSYAEISKILNIKVKTVEVRLARAKKRIRKLISEGGDFNE
jgi:RNA polymerase sigma-70 factor (ECF subfamily)